MTKFDLNKPWTGEFPLDRPFCPECGEEIEGDRYEHEANPGVVCCSLDCCLDAREAVRP